MERDKRTASVSTYKRVRCKRCRTAFLKKRAEQRYCSSRCAIDAKADKHTSTAPISDSRSVRFTKYSDLWFDNEEQFCRWFRNNYAEFGISDIIRMQTAFPDVDAVTATGRTLRIELEHHASNFAKHGHCGLYCDLVVAFLKSPRTTTIRGVPVVAIFDIRGDITRTNRTLRLTEFFQNRLQRNAAELDCFIEGCEFQHVQAATICDRDNGKVA